MRPLYTTLLGSLLSIGFALPASAQDTRPDQVTPAAAAGMPSSLTGKERLGKKWTDEQRIDNCNVPADKRGTRPRPSACRHVPMG